MFIRKLRALGYPKADSFHSHEESSLRDLVIWLEDEIFNSELPAQLNFDLRNAVPPAWKFAFRAYLHVCLCPFDSTAVSESVDWLLREALRLVETGRKDDGDIVFEQMDWDGKKFREGIAKMAAALHMPAHPDPRVTLEAIGILLADQLGNPEWKRGQSEVLAYSLDEVTLGFDRQDKAVRDACRTMRLLHVSRLRSLQTEMDIALVAVQNKTANPRTDSVLGRTGF